MAIINILVRTIIMFLCGIMRLIAVLLEGVSAFLGKLGEYLNMLIGKLMKVDNRPKNTNVAEFNVPM